MKKTLILIAAMISAPAAAQYSGVVVGTPYGKVTRLRDTYEQERQRDRLQRDLAEQNRQLYQIQRDVRDMRLEQQINGYVSDMYRQMDRY